LDKPTKIDMDNKVDSMRRNIIVGTAGLLASTAFLPFVGMASAQSQGSVPIGFIFAKQGAFTEHGKENTNGAMVALEEAGNKVLGKPINAIWLDEANPQMAQQNMEKLVTEHKVAAVVGGMNSATSLAISSVANRAKVPYIAPNAAARDLTGANCNPYTFRGYVTTSVTSRAIVPSLLGIGKNWYFLIASYAFGEDTYATMKGELDKAGGTQLGADRTPLGTTDFSSFILKIRQAKPDVVVLCLAGSDIPNFLKQYNEFGLQGTIPVASASTSILDLWALGDTAAGGIFGVQWHYTDPDNSPEDKAFTKAYITKHGQPPSDKAWTGWFATRMMLAAIELAKSTESAAIVKALETVTINEGGIAASFRPWDHQLLRRWIVVKARKGGKDKWDLVDKVNQLPSGALSMEALYGSKEEIGCNMPSL
jgi:branched-chain amino acid transport system substrate-binding protein